MTFSHVVLKIKVGTTWKVFDSNGLRPFYHGNFCKGSLTVEEIAKVAAVDCGWNDMFNRKQIPKMARLIHHHFKKMLSVINESTTILAKE